MKNPPNTQKPEPSTAKISGGRSLDVHSIFYTLQGEGPFSGHAAIFIRLAGCNLQCPGCDTEYTQGRAMMSIEEIFDACEMASSKFTDGVLIVITGGEPFRQNITDLCIDLVLNGNKVQIESNGVLQPTSILCIAIDIGDVQLVISPKTSRIHEWCTNHADCFKYVINLEECDETDGLPTTALGHKASPRLARPTEHIDMPVYISPMDTGDEDTNKQNIQLCAELVMRYGYILSLQTHKIIGVE